MIISLSSTAFVELSCVSFLPVSLCTTLHLTMGDASLLVYFHRIVTLVVVVFVTCTSLGGSGSKEQYVNTTYHRVCISNMCEI